ncbi:MAG: T9SS type A sorting domain-containing protein [Fidelibacterota bacterium]
MEGINPEAVNLPNCTDPCENPPCPEPAPNDVKSLFYGNKQAWLSQLAALPYLTDEAEIAAAEKEIDSLRFEMDKGANWILSYYSLDTTAIEVDSIVTWLGLVETYPADLRLARHYFFSGDFDAFDTLWAAIPSKYNLTDSMYIVEYDGLDDVYANVRPYVEAGTALDKLPQSVLDSLGYWATWCSEPGYLSQVLLWRNQVSVESDCSGGLTGRVATQEQNEVESVPEKSFRIYPNPALHEITIETPDSFEAGEAVIFSFQGNKVLSRVLAGTSNQLPVSDIPPGLYLLEIHDSRGHFERFKVIIIH